MVRLRKKFVPPGKLVLYDVRAGRRKYAVKCYECSNVEETRTENTKKDAAFEFRLVHFWGTVMGKWHCQRCQRKETLLKVHKEVNREQKSPTP